MRHIQRIIVVESDEAGKREMNVWSNWSGNKWIKQEAVVVDAACQYAMLVGHSAGNQMIETKHNVYDVYTVDGERPKPLPDAPKMTVEVG